MLGKIIGASTTKSNPLFYKISGGLVFMREEKNIHKVYMVSKIPLERVDIKF